MNARDVMGKPGVTVHPDTPTREIARLLLDKHISAVPVGASSNAKRYVYLT
jgi:CBS domain-containing protein